MRLRVRFDVLAKTRFAPLFFENELGRESAPKLAPARWTTWRGSTSPGPTYAPGPSEASIRGDRRGAMRLDRPAHGGSRGRKGLGFTLTSTFNILYSNEYFLIIIREWNAM